MTTITFPGMIIALLLAAVLALVAGAVIAGAGHLLDRASVRRFGNARTSMLLSPTS